MGAKNEAFCQIRDLHPAKYSSSNGLRWFLLASSEEECEGGRPKSIKAL